MLHILASVQLVWFICLEAHALQHQSIGQFCSMKHEDWGKMIIYNGFRGHIPKVGGWMDKAP